MRIGRAVLRALLSVLAALLTAPVVTAQDRAAAELFASPVALPLTITAPLDDLFRRAQSDPNATIQGLVTYSAGGHDIKLEGVPISVRGHTSKRETECSFPKLKLHVAKSPGAAHSIFAGLKAVKLGTHCGEAADGQLTPRFGRWANEKAPPREAVVYRLLNAFGVSTFLARPARVTYEMSGQRLIRNALLREDEDDFARRLGVGAEILPERFRSAEQDFKPEDAARLAFAEALVGNFDWCLRFKSGDTYRCDDRRGLWNVSAFARSEGAALPVPGDFDLAGMVTGRHLWFDKAFYAGFSASRSAPELEVVSQVQRTRTLFPRAVLDATRRSFLERRDAAYRVVRESEVDEDGRSRLAAYLDTFVAAIQDDAAFYRPVVARPNARVYRDAARSAEACGPGDAAPIGTVVGNPIATERDMIQVAVLDVLWKWAPPARCDAVHAGPVWIEKSAVSAEFPKP